MKYLSIVTYIVFILLIGFVSIYGFNSDKIVTSLKTKSIETDKFVEIDKRVSEEKSLEDDSKTDDEAKIDENDNITIDTVNNNVVEKKEESLPVVEEVQEASTSYEVQVGALSAYGPDCVGCSGTLASGFYAGSGNIYYQDNSYGNVRIVAGDRKYPFGTIVQISGTSLGDFNAIVLDRGGGIGFGKRFLFDLLFVSESDASNFGSYRNVSFTILRYGY